MGAAPRYALADTRRDPSALTGSPVDTDIHGEARGSDAPAVPNGPFGVFDLGVDEWKGLFVGDFEVGNCSLWSSATGGC